MTATRIALQNRLLQIQNNGQNDYTDMLTITGFMNEITLRTHVEQEELRAHMASPAVVAAILASVEAR